MEVSKPCENDSKIRPKPCWHFNIRAKTKGAIKDCFDDFFDNCFDYFFDDCFDDFFDNFMTIILTIVLMIVLTISFHIYLSFGLKYLRFFFQKNMFNIFLHLLGTLTYTTDLRVP